MEGLAAGHRERGHDVTVAAVLFTPGVHPVVEALRERGIGVHEIRLSSRAYVRERAAIRALCRSLQPDVVHTHGYRIDVVDRGVAARLRIPTVTTVHGPSMVGGWKGAVYEWMQRTNYRRFDAVVAVSRALHQITLADGVHADRLHLIPNAWGGARPLLSRAEARRRLRIDESASVIGWVGRMIPVKGGDVLLDALHRMPEPRPIAAMIGYGSEAERLEQRAAELGLDHVVRFYPDITDAASYYAAFDTFVLSSRSEGLPVVLLEAMAARVPIVATRVGGVPEAVGEEQALLVPADDPDALALAITRSLTDPTAARRRAENAADRLKAVFSFGPWLDRYEDVYRSLLQRRAARNGSGKH